MIMNIEFKFHGKCSENMDNVLFYILKFCSQEILKNNDNKILIS